MELIQYDALNCASGRKKPAFVSIDFKKGLFAINVQAVEKIGLTIHDHIIFHQDKNDPENWYIEMVSENGFPLRKNSSSNGLVVNNAAVAEKIAESVDFNKRTGKVMLAGQPTKVNGSRELWGLLVIGLRNQS